MARSAGMGAEPMLPWLDMRAVVGVMEEGVEEAMVHSASEVPSMMTSPRESSQEMGFWVVVAMVRESAAVSCVPVAKLFRSSVWEAQRVCGCAVVEASQRRDSCMAASAG